MALADAILEIAAAMAEEAKDVGEPERHSAEAHLVGTLRNYARQLRTAVKAAEGSALPAPAGGRMILTPGQDEARVMAEARLEAQENKRKAAKQEGMLPKMYQVEGGPCGGETAAMDQSMPVGARTRLGGATYVLRADGLLHHEEEAN